MCLPCTKRLIEIGSKSWSSSHKDLFVLACACWKDERDLHNEFCTLPDFWDDAFASCDLVRRKLWVLSRDHPRPIRGQHPFYMYLMYLLLLCLQKCFVKVSLSQIVTHVRDERSCKILNWLMRGERGQHFDLLIAPRQCGSISSSLSRLSISQHVWSHPTTNQRPVSRSRDQRAVSRPRVLRELSLNWIIHVFGGSLTASTPTL